MVSLMPDVSWSTRNQSQSGWRSKATVSGAHALVLRDATPQARLHASSARQGVAPQRMRAVWKSTFDGAIPHGEEPAVAQVKAGVSNHEGARAQCLTTSSRTCRASA